MKGLSAKLLPRLLLAATSALILVAGFIWAYFGAFGFVVIARHGGTYWVPVSTDSSLLSASMRLALAKAPPAMPGEFTWRLIRRGFEVAELPALAEGKEVDRLMLARIDPGLFRFVLRSAPLGDKDLDRWMAEPGVALVVNGSYYGRTGEPDTPFLSAGVLLGPADYDAKAGAFVASPTFTGIRDLEHTDWRSAFQGADNAMVSFPLLLLNGQSHVARASRWLANRSFVGQDAAGRILVGTTRDAFFSLDRLARFLLDAPLGLTMALNLDGGPVACQGISLDGYERRSYGRWEAQVEGDRAYLLTWPYGTFEMPVVLTILPK